MVIEMKYNDRSSHSKMVCSMSNSELNVVSYALVCGVSSGQRDTCLELSANGLEWSASFLAISIVYLC